MTAVSEKFSDADTRGMPPLHELDDRAQVLWVMQVGADHLGLRVMTAAEISDALRDAYGISVSRQRVLALLSAERRTVAARKRDGRRAFQIMEEGRAVVGAASGGAMFVDPDAGYSGLRQVHSIFSAMRGTVRVCDPYTDLRTLDALAECSAADEIRLLTKNIKKQAGISHAARLFSKEHGVPLEIRTASAAVLHDRYAIHDDGMVMFGTSLNGLGLKQTFVVALGEDIRSIVMPAYDALWAAAQPV